jgi:hypothetical protein
MSFQHWRCADRRPFAEDPRRTGPVRTGVRGDNGRIRFLFAFRFRLPKDMAMTMRMVTSVFLRASNTCRPCSAVSSAQERRRRNGRQKRKNQYTFKQA